MKRFILRRLLWITLIGGSLTGGGIATYNGIFSHENDRAKSNIRVIISAGHSSIIDNSYQTAGKQSPRWADSLKIYEGVSVKGLSYALLNELGNYQIDAQLINPELEDVSLVERVVRTNGIASRDTRSIFLSIHHNAQRTQGMNTDYCDDDGNCGWYSAETGGASSIIVFTSTGNTESDIIAEYIATELSEVFSIPVYLREANFYVLRKTYCPAVLIEFCFMTTKTDCDIIASKLARNAFVNAVAKALYQYNFSLNKKVA